MVGMSEEVQITKQTGRLDKVAAQLFPDYSRSQLQRLIVAGDLLVNDQQVVAKYQVRTGDRLKLTPPPIQHLSLEPENIPLDIVYEDADLLVVNKPQGMVVHPAPGHPNHTLVNALLYHCPLSTINGTYRPGIVHRIDKDTSGLLMVAKNDLAHQALAKQLKAKKNLREYTALVHGRMPNDQGTIIAPLGRSRRDRKKQAVVADGRPAITHYRVIKRYQYFTLIKCVLETGRTHQIRVHLRYLGFPLAGDPLYGPTKTLKGHGQFLHAGKLGFEHPRTHQEMIFEAPLPEIFQKTLEKLDKNENFK
ncbi:ribosomal large subunit pseudouridine synthase D [Liquorilactobacillus ghanensis DSM 18630]|uniref:Pseudouridine synthase n=1 Tax=Liquorilactobacillus ghanensis DSM 18630 TaxID=1423750 RepID=A0A0R1VQ05_9LACO|nr:RluA family pseudouridine synthase [Liquorilactobacillus ghanensis]KRM07936.1 ribosomal large subunit pseudouridine synthase D [Liquorilactobacillus ghanensis DSM 18630]